MSVNVNVSVLVHLRLGWLTADNCSARFVGLMLSADEHGMPATMSRGLPGPCTYSVLWPLHARTPFEL